MDAAQPYGWVVVAELLDGFGEPFMEQFGVLAVISDFAEALATVDHEQGDHPTEAGDDAEGDSQRFEEPIEAGRSSTERR